MTPHQPPDPLDSLLDQWKDVPPPPRGMNARVWEHIATHPEPEPVGFLARVESWFERPAFSVGFVAACALAGLLLAEVRVGQLQRERSSQLARNYLLLIDPLLSEPRGDDR